MIAAIVAGVLAVVGGTFLVAYVQGADARAIAGQQPVSVVVVTAPIARGATGVEAVRSMALRQVPAATKLPDALTAMPDLTGKVASVDMVVGEQVLGTRFVDPTAAVVNDPVEVPPKLQQVSIVLPPERVIGSHLNAGDTVGVFMSFDFDPEAKDEGNIKATALTLNRVLVTRVAGVRAATGTTASPGTVEAPSAQVMVTLALNAHDAERLIFAKEWGKIWLSLQRETTDLGGATTVTGGNVFK